MALDKDKQPHTADEDAVEAQVEQHESTKPKKSEIAILTVGLCLAVFLLSIDRTIVAVAIPKITDTFHSFADVGWYGSSYLITVCAVQPVFGRVYTAFNTKWIYITAFGIFEIGSLICAVAPSSAALIVGRAIAGVGAGGVLSGSYVIIAQVIPLEVRPAYTAAVSMMFSLGAIVAPLIGAGLTQHVTWRWCFYINLPIGLPVMLGMTLFFKPPDKARTSPSVPLATKILSLDLLGATLLLGSATMLFLALQYAADGYPWRTALVAGLLTGSFITIILFGLWQLRFGEKALIISRILQQRTILASSIANITMYAALVSYIYFLAMYFQAIRGTSIVGSAVDLLPLVISCSVFSIVAGVLVTKIGYFAPPAIVGMGLTVVGAGPMTMLNPSTGVGHWAGYQILIGVGLGLALQQGFFGVQAVLFAEDVPIGTSLITFCQSLGGALGVSIGNCILLNILRGSREQLLDHGVEVDDVINAGATGFRALIRQNSALAAVVSVYGNALNRVFITAAVAAAVTFLACCCMEWRKTTDQKLVAVDPDTEAERPPRN